MSLDLWEDSPPEIQERWRSIAKTLRGAATADVLPRALQTCFWYGASATAHSEGPKSEMTLRHLLPAERVQDVRPRALRRP